MHSAHIFFVQPRLPENLAPLQELALNVHWPNYLEIMDLFRRLNPEVWEKTGQNPLVFLRSLSPERLIEASKDYEYIKRLERVWNDFKNYSQNALNWNKYLNFNDKSVIAFFSAEFGLAQSLPNYAGGLGLLAGDYLKSISDLAIPMAGIGLLYREGYFRQTLDIQGWQNEIYPHYNFHDLPLELILKEDDTPLTIEIKFPDRMVRVQIWRALVGRLSLYLLDTDCPNNRDEDRRITDRLYGGDLEKRIQQEIILGIGGMKALAALGIEPAACHLNEGHSGFLALERICQFKAKYNLDLAQARELAACSNIFTTHTPVTAGIDLFPTFLMDKYFTEYYQNMGMSREDFLALGRNDPYNHQESFNMAVMALRLSTWTNGVSKLHGETACKMWQGCWPELPLEEVPIKAITNGVHVTTWTAQAMADLYDRYLGNGWRENPTDQDSWSGINQIPDHELWQAREIERNKLVQFVRRRLSARLESWGVSQMEMENVEKVFDPHALTIGFARRFATYKRPTLLFHDPERLARLLKSQDRPLQIVFAGKAHPKDEEGKRLIQKIIGFSKEANLQFRIAFLDDYDINIARYLVSGVDVWLGNPRRPLEASSTSGMKTVLNGILNISTLDGWWDEAWIPETGWAIGGRENYGNSSYQDALEAENIYNLLEKEIIPLFYNRNLQGLPLGWLAKIRRSIETYAPVFNTHRMAKEYTDEFYIPAIRLFEKLSANQQQKAKELATYKKHLFDQWRRINIERVDTEQTERDLLVGDNVQINAQIYLGQINPQEVTVEAYSGPVDNNGAITLGERITLTEYQELGEGRYLYQGLIPCRQSGRYGYNVRILPCHEDLGHPYIPQLILWG